MAPTSSLGTTTTIVILLLIVTVVIDSAEVGNGSEFGEFMVVTPKKVNAVAGSKILLPCSYTCTISSVVHTLVEWSKIMDGYYKTIYVYSNRYSYHWPLQATWVGNVSKCNASITVSDIETHDSGRYRCEVSVLSHIVLPEYKQDIGYLQLNVQPRTELAIVTPEAKEATVGSTALLSCSYNCTIMGINHTLVEWFRTIGGHDEKVYKITHRKRSLRPLQVTWVGNDSTCDASITISNIQPHDTGRYRCAVTVYRYDKPSMEDIGYLQLIVPKKPEPKTEATLTSTTNPTSAPAPAPSPVTGIVLGVILVIDFLIIVAGVVWCCKRRRTRPSQTRESANRPRDMQPMIPVGEDAGGNQVKLHRQSKEISQTMKNEKVRPQLREARSQANQSQATLEIQQPINSLLLETNSHRANDQDAGNVATCS